MIPRTRRPAPAAGSEPTPTETPAVEPVEYLDLDFWFGPDDVVQFTLAPDDSFVIEDARFVIVLTRDDIPEQVEIDRAKVRVWSQRWRTALVPTSLDPADQEQPS